MTTNESSQARERVLNAAERLFNQRGYTAVTLRDIANELDIKQASLYHHVPGGKEQLFIEVTERTLRRHRTGLEQAIAGAGDGIEAQLHAAGAWLLSQPPMDLVRMTYSDMPAIDQVHAQRLSQDTYDALLGPIEAAIEQAHARGEIVVKNAGLIAGGVLGMIESLHAVPQHVFEYGPEYERQAMARELINTLLNGLRPRS